MEIRIMRPRIINIISHVAGWIIFFSLIIGFLSNNPQNRESIFSKLFAAPFIIFYFTFLFIFYINYFVLIPFLYLKKQYAIYFLIIVILFTAVYFIKPFDRLISMSPPPGQRSEMMNWPPPPNGFESSERPGNRMPPPRFKNEHSGRKDINSIILFIMVWSLSTAICIIRQWRLTEKRALQAETDKANAELSFLKSQVNPHFLFNTLNNIYSLAVTNNENTAPSIMKLSNIMRYLTDEAGENYVSLDSEIACIRDYIDLQKMRLGKNTKVDFSVSGNTVDKKIPPLILMTFIENVFKYGVSNHEASDIIIKLAADDHNMTFFCQNKLFDSKRSIERTGIGIFNAQQRLKHLYPDKHFLDISKKNGLFTVQLTLQA